MELFQWINNSKISFLYLFTLLLLVSKFIISKFVIEIFKDRTNPIYLPPLLRNFAKLLTFIVILKNLNFSSRGEERRVWNLWYAKHFMTAWKSNNIATKLGQQNKFQKKNYLKIYFYDFLTIPPNFKFKILNWKIRFSPLFMHFQIQFLYSYFSIFLLLYFRIVKVFSSETNLKIFWNKFES